MGALNVNASSNIYYKDKWCLKKAKFNRYSMVKYKRGE